MASKRSIQFKLRLMLLGVGVLPLVALGGGGVLSARSVAIAGVADANRQLALRAADQISRSLNDRMDLLATMALTAGLVQLAPDRLSLLLHSFANHRVEESWVVDVEGNTLARSWRGGPAIAADDPAVKSALRAHRYLGPVTVDRNLMPRARFAVPLLEEGGVVGAVVALVALAEPWKLIDEVRIGRTGYALLLDDDGSLFAHGDPRGKKLVPSRPRFARLVALAHSAEGASFVRRRGTLDNDVLSIAVPVRGTAWTLVLEQDASEALAPAWRLSLVWLALVTLGVLASTIAGTKMARRSVVEPIQKLKAAAAEFAARRFAHRVQLDTGDELEDLGHALERMADDLGLAYQELARTEQARALALISAGLGHDLKHPVAALEAVNMRARTVEPAEAQRRLGEAALRELPKLRELVERLRDIDRAGQRRDVDFPAEALAEAGESSRAAAAERGVALIVERPEANLLLRGDLMQLSCAIENLLSNALAATPAGKSVRLSVRQIDARQVAVSVADTGPGIPKEILDQLFQPFTGSRRLAGGLGLGLFVVQRVAQLHGGRAEVESALGSGTTFTLLLPIVQPQGAARALSG